jgi:type III secretion system (T3SS) inner membrane Yop/YscD-like protein
LADDKKDFDPDKTVVDFRRDAPPVRPSSPPPDEEKTMVVSMPPPRPPADEDRTLVAPIASVSPTHAADAESERTMIRPSAAPEARPSSGFEVVCLSGPSRGRRFDVPENGALVGSNPTCDVVIAGIEGAHAKITKRGADFEIQNLGTPGSIIFAGGRSITSARMKAGDVVKIGDAVVRLVQSGQVFSSEFDETEFKPSAVANLLAPERRLYVIGGAIGVIILLLLLFPSGESKAPPPKAQPTKSIQNDVKKRVDALLAAGETLMKEGRLFAPTDQPDAENAYGKFDQALALDPGNPKALAAMKQIDAERDKQRTAREEERRRQEEAKRKALEAQVNAVLARGDELFQKGMIAEPAGNNALIRYREALKIDPLSTVAQEKVHKALAYYVDRGDEAREKGDLWTALENYRKASRAAEGKDPDIEARLHEVERTLTAGMSTDIPLIMYKDDNGRTVVLDEIDKVPARYRDRALTVQPRAAARP